MRIVIDMQGAQSSSRRRGIGRYTLALVRALARHPGGHEIWLAFNGSLGAHDELATLQAAFSDMVPRERMRVFDVATPVAENAPGNGARARAAEPLREAFLAALRPDAVLVTSLFEGFVDDAVTSVGSFTGGAATAVILYDLIPFLNPDKYLGTALQRAHYERKLASLRRAGLLLAISDFTRSEAVEALGIAAERVVAVSTAIDARFCPGPVDLDALRARFGIARPFVMYAPGGADARKNIDGLLRAFAGLPPALRGAHQLLLASEFDGEQLPALRRAAAAAGLAPGELVLTGHVDDAALIDLYRSTALFVFPSLHEGFGLPALEAMACGAAVIGADNTSIPEVIGLPEALFDGADPAAIAAAMARVLADPALAQRLRAHGRSQAARFSWEATAERTLRALERHHARPQPATAPAAARPRLALVAPLPADAAGVHGTLALAAGLRAHAEVELVVEQADAALTAPLAQLPLRGAAWFMEHAREYDHILYRLGDSARHAFISPLLHAHPGIVLLDDFFLGQAIAADDLHEALYGAHGYPALLAGAAAPAQALATYPCNRALLADARGVLVRDETVRALGRDWYGAAAVAGWQLLPAADAPPEAWGALLAADRGAAAQDRGALLRALAQALQGGADEATLQELARCLACMPDPLAPRQLLFDVTTIARHDLRTGIERVVRAQLDHLLRLNLPGLRIEPVRLCNDHGRWEYRYARAYTCALLGMPGTLAHDPAVDIAPGDVFYGADYAPLPIAAAAREGLFAGWRARGVEINFMVYDLLPVLRPDFFPAQSEPAHRAWLRAVSASADRLLCISGAVADDLAGWLDGAAVRSTPLELAVLHLGADLDRDSGDAAQAAPVPPQVKAAPSFLMVGTIEPRKGHLQALDAFELLWAEGVDANLVIVGNEGWKPLARAERRTIPRIVERLERHPQLGKRLLWLRGVDDAALRRLYEECACLLAPSEGEGFGLPLIEAAHRGIPILARDLPVFREVAGAHAAYFGGLAARALADAVNSWLAAHGAGRHVASAGMPWMTWEQNARLLWATLSGQRAQRTWSAPDRAALPPTQAQEQNR